ncbi:hypothetical protein [Evansella tamaricis]|uniref:DUF1700 domain-containing protein n=1 Tax=Evansella tamaricis TaxID=2069301 RepID=A0ABS6JG82_9BACI|nr:hypothetical protein [Evansella tamaricis]MBU9712548.1 hypothetical protein [Evansella tamaricis]
MNDEQLRHLVEDLLPLYEEGLLSPETTDWLEEQLKKNKELQEVMKQIEKPLPKGSIDSPVNDEKMFKKINQRLSLFQIIFVGISFILAISTSLMNDSFGFIFWYTVLGLVTYLFYKDMKIVFYITFIPIFLWSIGDSVLVYWRGHYIDGITIAEFIGSSLFGAFMMTIIHYLFALIGSIIGWIILKLKEKDGDNREKNHT